MVCSQPFVTVIIPDWNTNHLQSIDHSWFLWPLRIYSLSLQCLLVDSFEVNYNYSIFLQFHIIRNMEYFSVYVYAFNIEV